MKILILIRNGPGDVIQQALQGIKATFVSEPNCCFHGWLPDREAIMMTVLKEKPDLMLAFGRLLTEAARKVGGCKVISGPAVSLPDHEFMAQLEGVIETVKKEVESFNPDDEFTILGHKPTGQREML